MKQYGVFIGRCQPFHLGHQSILDRIVQDGLEPVALLGSANESGTEKNPYDVHPRATMMRFHNPLLKIGAVSDYESNEDWMEAIILCVEEVTGMFIHNSTFYLHDKPEDFYDFTYKGVEYKNASYSKMYEAEGLNVVHLPISDIKIRATSIREDLEKHSHYLQAEVYEYIKGLLC